MAKQVLEGRAGSPGAGVGRLIRVHTTIHTAIPSPHPMDPAQRQHEQDRLRRALDLASQELAQLAEQTRERAGADVAAISTASARQADVLAAVEDEYFSARAADIRDVGKRAVAILEGRPRPSLLAEAGQPAVLAADDLDASVVAELRLELVAGVALAGGAATGHAAIVAGALGRLLVAPDATDRLAVTANGTTHVSLSQLPPLELPVVIEGNAGSVREVEQAAAAGAYGIGLLRTELLFLGRSVPPGLDEQRALYRRIREAMPRGTVVYRTLDVGGDKPAGYGPALREANPALGVRGVRLGLRHPELLEIQLRALLESTPELALHVMFPMVATLEEVLAARTALERAASASLSAGQSVAREVHLGIMIEVPAAALMAEILAPAVDFFSIGTNDLVQYTMAADRTSADLADLATALQPAVLRLIDRVCQAAQEHRRPVAVCGEAAANPQLAPLLAGLGVTHLSVAAQSVATVHQALTGSSLDACRAAAAAALRAHTVAEVQRIAISRAS